MFLLPFIFCTYANAENTLTVTQGQQTKTYTATELLKSPKAKKFTIEKDQEYGGETRTYDVVPLSVVLPNVKGDDDGTVVFHALDGFSAPLLQKRILNSNPKEAIAYLAIEPPDKPWPQLRPLHPETAGPFRVVWEHPELSQISREEWPYQVTSMDVAASIEKQYPDLAPSASGAVKRGFSAFMKNCFACHKLNGQGEAELGPDLNIPHNPTEYFTAGYIQKLVRDPQSLRTWAKAKMPAFSRESLSDADLHDVVSYLKYISAHKKKSY